MCFVLMPARTWVIVLVFSTVSVIVVVKGLNILSKNDGLCDRLYRTMYISWLI